MLLSLLLAGANAVSGFSGTAGANVGSGFPVRRSLGEGGSRTNWFMAENDAAVAIGDDATAAARVLASLTMARAVMKQVAVVESLPPVRAFAVKNEASLRELVPQYWERRGVRPSGASYTGPHAAFIAVRTDIPVAQQFPLLLHEYTHLLTAAHVPDAPAWLDEGLSGFWGAIVLDGPQVVIGRPPAHHLKLLRTRAWLPPDEMRAQQRGKLTADSARASMFYAQSWAMVHYLLLGRDSTLSPPFAPADRRWTPQLAAAVRAYVTRGQFREVAIQLDPKIDVGSGFLVRRSLGEGGSRTEPHPISEARALAERASMLVFGERPDAALPMARRALSLDSREPLALEVMGTHAFLHNQPDQARAWLSRALDANPDSYTSALYLALLSSSTPDRERYLQAAVRAKPDLAVAWQRLWTLYDEDGRGEQMRRWCRQLSGLLQPLMSIASTMPCDWQGMP